MDKILAVIPVHNRRETTLRFLSSLKNQNADGFELDVLIVDDGSTDGTAAAVSRRFPEIIIIRGDGSLWWAGGINVGFSYALKNSYGFVYTVNDDIDLLPDTVYHLYQCLKKIDQPAVCSSTFFNYNGKLIFAGYILQGRLKKWRQISHSRHTSSSLKGCSEIDSVASKSTLIPVEIIRVVGFFDTAHFPHNFSDIEYFHRVKKMEYPLIVSVESRIYTNRSDSNFHQLLMEKDLISIVKTFTEKKYANNFKTLYYTATLNEPILLGIVMFLYKLIPYATWIVLKMIMPKNTLRQLLLNTGRLD